MMSAVMTGVSDLHWGGDVFFSMLTDLTLHMCLAGKFIFSFVLGQDLIT